MADKKNPDSGDKKSELMRFASSMESRMESLLKISLELEQNLAKIEEDLNNQEQYFASEFDNASEGIGQLKIEIKRIANGIENSIVALRRTAKQEDFEMLQHFAEHWTPEEWVTRKELKKMVGRAEE